MIARFSSVKSRGKVIQGLVTSEISGQQLGRKNNAILFVWRLVANVGLADFDLPDGN